MVVYDPEKCVQCGKEKKWNCKLQWAGRLCLWDNVEHLSGQAEQLKAHNGAL